MVTVVGRARSLAGSDAVVGRARSSAGGVIAMP
jgi:hypothetical protein